ncbi:acyltransferase family protein [Pedobacter sp. BG31]|uniref:acyltransferase family protein n=1 Tax=Pedobacter sp. BG31 TaxID=3349697 RepID=UPI0035F3A9EE
MIRLIAALMVIYGHSFILFDPKGYSEPVGEILKNEYSGSLAVALFFFFGGLFVTQSYEHSKPKSSYLLKRLFRIWPALIICTLITVFIAGPFLTELPVYEYFTSKETWKYLFLNCTIVFRAAYNLPGVFINNHYPNTVNGSFWTLPAEVRYYCLVFFLGIFNIFKKPMLLVSFVIGITLLFTTDKLTANGLTTSNITVKLLIIFLAGSLSYAYRRLIIIDYRIALVLVLITLLSYFIYFQIIILYITMIYSALAIGISRVFKKLHLQGDYSYGIYIYGFLVQQIVANKIPELSSYQSMLITIPLSFILAILSWNMIEKPAITYLKGKNNQLQPESNINHSL